MGSSRRRRNSNSAGRARSVQKPSKQRKPSKLRAGGNGLRDVKRGTQANVPAPALLELRKVLELIQSSAIVVAHALREQNVELDEDAADVLRRQVSDVLQDQIETIDSLLEGVVS
jgi:hypothetical protein